MILQLGRMACNRRDKLVGAGNEDRSRSDVFREIDHEPGPFGGLFVRIGAKVSFSVDCLEARMFRIAIDRGNRNAAPGQIPHQYDARLSRARHYYRGPTRRSVCGV